MIRTCAHPNPHRSACGPATLRLSFRHGGPELEAADSLRRGLRASVAAAAARLLHRRGRVPGGPGSARRRRQSNAGHIATESDTTRLVESPAGLQMPVSWRLICDAR